MDTHNPEHTHSRLRVWPRIKNSASGFCSTVDILSDRCYLGTMDVERAHPEKDHQEKSEEVGKQASAIDFAFTHQAPCNVSNT